MAPTFTRSPDGKLTLTLPGLRGVVTLRFALSVLPPRAPCSPGPGASVAGCGSLPRGRLGPAHCLLLREPLGDRLVDRALDEAGVPSPFARNVGTTLRRVTILRGHSGQQNGGHLRPGLSVNDRDDNALGRPFPKLLDGYVASALRVVEAATSIPLHEDRLSFRSCRYRDTSVQVTS